VTWRMASGAMRPATPGPAGRQLPFASAIEPIYAGDDYTTAAALTLLTWLPRKFGDNQRRMCGTSVEPALPDMTRRMMPPVIAPGMGDRKGLQDPADRLFGLRPEKKVKVIGHETIAEEPQGVALPSFGKCIKEGEAVGIIAENVSAVVAAVEGVINQAVVYRAR
jgi:hypothetical protein